MKNLLFILLFFIFSNGFSQGLFVHSGSGPSTYYYCPDGIDIGQTTWTITGIEREADSLWILVNDTALYRIIGDSSLTFTDRSLIAAPTVLTNAPYGLSVFDPNTKIQYITEDVDTLKWNADGWLFKIKQPIPSTLLNDLVAYWALEEASGTIYDATANDYDGTAYNTPTYGATGKVGNAIDFERDQQEYIGFGTSLNIGTDDFTVSAWIYMESDSVLNGILGKHGTGNTWYLYVDGGTNRLTGTIYVSANYVAQGIIKGALSQATWYHCVWLIDRDGNSKLYIDNIYQSNQVVDISGFVATDITNTNNLQMGQRGDLNASYYFDGIIDEVGVWSRLLTTDEIAELFNSGNGITYPFK